MDAGTNNTLTQLGYTGERMVPEGTPITTFWEHIYRYRFATRYTAGRDVLDVACGEGYGSAALLKSGAKSVIGVDVDGTICDYARRKYNIDARQGDAASLPFPADSFDLVVSFETIEHLPEPTRFLDECVRVLRPSGLCVISTPNVAVYNPGRNSGRNRYHCSEMTEAEFILAVSTRFCSLRSYSQCPTAAKFWSTQALRIPRTPWREVKGFWRLQKRCRALRPEMEQASRLDPVAEILRPEGRLSRLVNPYAVTSRRQSSQETPTYFVCVAHTLKQK
jgi:ubiquinone/menaquinone biosynthesis C-methylase UbiE